MLLPLYYFTWHYTRAIADLLRIWSNFFWFFWHLFSIPLLLRTLLTPFHRLHETYRPGLRPEDWASAFIVNTLMRLVGMVVRLFTILIGLLFIALTLALGALMLAAWIAAPVLVVFLIGSGFAFLVM